MERQRVLKTGRVLVELWKCLGEGSGVFDETVQHDFGQCTGSNLYEED